MLLNFKKQFVPFILAGAKTHTIRATRANPPRVGEMCHCYTGLRQKGAKLLGRWPCVKVETITIHAPQEYALSEIEIAIDGEQLSRDECEALARRDGFRSFDAMMVFWEGRLPFTGAVIHWRKDD